MGGLLSVEEIPASSRRKSLPTPARTTKLDSEPISAPPTAASASPSAVPPALSHGASECADANCTCEKNSAFIQFASEHCSDLKDLKEIYAALVALQASGQRSGPVTRLLEVTQRFSQFVPLLMANAQNGRELVQEAIDEITEWRHAAVDELLVHMKQGFLK